MWIFTIVYTAVGAPRGLHSRNGPLRDHRGPAAVASLRSGTTAPACYQRRRAHCRRAMPISNAASRPYIHSDNTGVGAGTSGAALRL